MIQNKLLHFETRAAFEAAKRYPGIADTSIAFVKEGRTIYTHGVEYNASASVDIDSTIQQYLENLYQDIYGDVYTKEQVDTLLNTKQPTLVSGTNIKTINGQSLLGSGNINIEGGEDVEGEAGGHWENIYKATLTDATPTLPTNFDNNPEGWAHYAENSDGSKVIWMATRFVDGAGNAKAWQGPWRISGANGEAGVDGDSIEYIYARTTVEDSSILSNPNASYNNNSAFQVDD